MNKKVFSFILLLLLPTIFIIIGFSFQRTQYAGDPDYIYLMNALNLSRFKDAGHIDNPGTTVMELGAAIITSYHIFTNSGDRNLGVDVIKNPDNYVEVIRLVFIFFIGIVLFWAGWIALKYSQNIWHSLILQITPLLSVNLLDHTWTKVSPEPVLVLISTLLLILLFHFSMDSNKSRWKYVVLFALIAGAGLATKATFIPLIIIPLFLIPGFRKKLIFLAGMIAVFFILTSPAHNEYPRMFRWFKGLITHTGIYGGGESGLVEIDSYLMNIWLIIRNNLVFSFVLIFSIIIFLWLWMSQSSVAKKTIDWTARLHLAIIVSAIAGILMVAKHYHANHYLIPVISLSGMMLILSLYRLKLKINYPAFNKQLPLILLIAFVFIFSVWSVPKLQQKNSGYRATNNERENLDHFISGNYAGYNQLINIPNSINKLSALAFGNGYSKLNNMDLLQSVYPSVRFLNSMGNNFFDWSREVEVSSVVNRSEKKLLIKGYPLTSENYYFLQSHGLFFSNVFEGTYNCAYVLDTTGSFIPGLTHIKERILSISCGAESLGDNDLYFSNGKYVFSSGQSQSDENARTGLYSAKTDKNNPFSLAISLNHLNPGSEINCSVWRYGNNPEGKLVISDIQNELFYLAEHEPDSIENSGWVRIVLQTIVPELPHGNGLKIYLWNRGESPIYFDDLEIQVR